MHADPSSQNALVMQVAPNSQSDMIFSASSAIPLRSLRLKAVFFAYHPVMDAYPDSKSDAAFLCVLCAISAISAVKSFSQREE